MKKNKGSIKKRLVGIILLVTSLTGLLGYATFISWYLNDQDNRTLLQAQTMSKVLSQNFAKLILLNEVDVAAEITTQLSSFQNLNSMVLYTLKKEAIFQYSNQNKGFSVDTLPEKPDQIPILNDNILTLYVDANYLSTHLGYVQLKLVVETLSDIVARDISSFVLVYFLMIIFSYLLAVWFTKRFTQPIINLVSFLETVDQVDISHKPIYTKETNEFGILYQEVNTMLARIESSQEDKKIAAAAFNTQSGMTITDANQKILQVNKAFTKITGYESHEAVGKTPAILKSGLHNKSFYNTMQETLARYHYWSGEIYNRHKDGTIFPEYITIQVVLNDAKETMYYVASFVDLTLQKETEKKLQYLKKYDTLTGLSNRELFVEEVQNHLNTLTQSTWGALICFSIKDFTLIHDAYGHDCTDGLLLQITQRLKKDFEDATLIGRISAEEFVLWYTNIDVVKDTAIMQAKTLAQYLRSVLTQAFTLDDKTIRVEPYVGLSLYGSSESDASKLLKQADSALHMCEKNDQKFAFFNTKSEHKAMADIDMYTQLITAVEEHQFELVYQLQYHNDGEIYGAEALIRWYHPKQGLISPVEFIPIAEKTGLILPIGAWVIQSACEQIAQWQKDTKSAKWIIAINISAKQFMQDDFIDQVKSAVTNNGIAYKSLKLELTEYVLAEDIEMMVIKMQQLQALGIQLSLDDFGTGYSSLQYLKELPLNQVKIDQAFIRNLLDSKSDIAIVKSILLLGEALDLEIIAEGVETKEQYDFLNTLGCKLYQGYYFAKPQKVHDINSQYLSQNKVN